MIGYFNYTVWLTYLSLMSGTLGIIVSLTGHGHPYWGVFFLLFSGFCDAFDGRVARSKPNRTETEKAFGVQIDSLSDLVAFGVLPAAIGGAMLQLMAPSKIPLLRFGANIMWEHTWIFMVVLMLYVLAGMIRLAYFNVMEEERQKTEGNTVRKTYTGLPITAAALIFPTVLLLQHSTYVDITIVYFLTMLITAFLFVSKIQVPKPGLKAILVMVAIGAVEFLIHIII